MKSKSNPLGYDELLMPAVASDNNSGFDRQGSRAVFPVARNRYYHIAVDGVGGAQGRVVLNYQVGSSPELTVQPLGGAWRIGDVVIRVIHVRSRAPVAYQWRLNGTLLNGATNATLVIPIFQSANVGRYNCVASNFAGVAATSEAVVGVDTAEALRLFGRQLPDGTFGLLISGTSVSNAVLQVSPNLMDWLPIYTNLGPGGAQEFMDRSAPNQLWRFYRVVRQP